MKLTKKDERCLNHFFKHFQLVTLRVYDSSGNGDTVQDLARIAAGETPVNVRLAFQKKENPDNECVLIDDPEKGDFIGCDTPLEAGKVFIPGLQSYLKDKYLSSENDQFTSEELDLMQSVFALAVTIRLFYQTTACLSEEKESGRLMVKIGTILDKQQAREKLKPLVDKMDD